LTESKKLFPLILASASPARAELLKKAGYSFTIVVSDSEGDAKSSENPYDYAIQRAIVKAKSVAETVDSGVIIGADTIAWCNGKIVGKPANPKDAKETLFALSSNPHEVITGLAVIVKPCGSIIALSESTKVVMHPMSQTEINEYVASGEAMGKAGSYAIQETGDKFVDRIEGSFSNIVGIPMELLAEVLEFLKNRGIFTATYLS